MVASSRRVERPMAWRKVGVDDDAKSARVIGASWRYVVDAHSPLDFLI